MGNTKGTSGFRKVLILAVVLLLPGFLYYLLERTGENRYRPLPIYGEKTLTGTFTSRMGKQVPDTAYHLAGPFTLTNQLGEAVTVPKGDTSIAVVNFFYTRCETFCTHMNNEMNRVAERFATNKMVNLYTVSVDTAFDKPEVIKAYSDAYKPHEKQWHFLTAGPDDPLMISRDYFLVDAVQDTTTTNRFIHSSSLILLDSHRRIRGYYDVNHKKEVDRLIDEIKLLLVEEIRETSPY